LGYFRGTGGRGLLYRQFSGKAERRGMRERRRDLRDMFDAALIDRVNRIRGKGKIQS